MKIIFLNYNILPDYHSPEEWIKKIAPSTGIMESLSKKAEIHYFIRIGYTGNYFHNGVNYHFIKTEIWGSHFAFTLHRSVQKINPDIVLVFSLHFSFHKLQLKYFLPSKTKIIAEHQADIPSTGFRRILEKFVDKFIDQYHFTTIENAEEWLTAKVISNKQKCKTISLASTNFRRQDKILSRQITGMNKSTNFLFVGRLHKNKDPLTILKAFEKYLSHNTDAALHLVYQEYELIEQVKQFIHQSETLKKNVVLHGKKEYVELETWYSAADFIISASRIESGSFSIIEAMACGCIPIVSNVPSSLTTIEDGNYGFIFNAGNEESLYKTLLQTNAVNRYEYSLKTENYFKQSLSFDKIAENFYALATNLIAE